MPLTSAVELDEKKFISSVNEVVNDLADIAKVVILGRGAGIILKDRKKVLRIAINLDKENRIKNLKKLNNINFKESQRIVSNSDEAQQRYFNRAFNCSPFDPNMYHMIYNKSLFTVEELAMSIIKLYKDFINSEIYKNA